MSRPAHRLASIFPRASAQLLPLAGKQSQEPLVRIHIIGEMRASTFLGDDVLPRGRKAQAILGCLCLAAGMPLRRGQLAAMLWDRVPPDQARASFRQAFRELTVPLGDLADEIFEADRETIRLNVDLCWIDALAVTAPLDGDVRRDLAGHCQGDLLAKLDDVSTSFSQWVVDKRAQFVEQLRCLLEREAGEDAKESPASQRADIALRLIDFCPTYEGAWRVLMRALTDMERPAQALEEYIRCEHTLQTLLGVKPSPETRALHAAMRASLYAEQGVIDFVHIPPRQAAALVQPAPLARKRLRVGVLSFRAPASLQDDALLLSHEVVTELQRFRWFDVISLNGGESAGTPQNRDLIHRNGLDFVIDGALSGAGNVQRVDVRMLEMTQYAAPIWSDRITVAGEESYRIDEVTARIVARIDPVIAFIQPKREGQGATALLRRAIPLMYSMNREKYQEAGGLLTQAIAEDPKNAKAAAWGAYWQVFYVGQGWARDQDRGEALATAKHLARTAVDIDPEDAEAHGIHGHICSFLDKDFDAALRHFERALRLNPNLGHAWALSAVTHCYIGEPDDALARMDRYRDLAPYDPFFSFFEGVYAIAYIIKGDYARAAEVGRRLVATHPKFSNAYKPLIAALGLLGLREEAKSYVERLADLEPDFTVALFGKTYPFRREQDRERYMEGLRLAGVREA
jgi:DNA-binding SARP family transcriptional activator/TolB-like protein